MENLFTLESKKLAPLADRLRPKNLDEFLGQEHIASKNSFLRYPGTAVFEFENGVIATVEGTVNVPGSNMEEHLTVIGENGVVKLGGKSANTIDIWQFTDAPDEDKDGFHEKTLNVYGNGHASLFEDMALAIKEDRAPYVDANAGKRALEAVLAIYKSAYEGVPVELPLDNCAGIDFEDMFKR